MSAEKRPVRKTDPYALLQVHPRACAEVIEASYRALLRQRGSRVLGDTGVDPAEYDEAHRILMSEDDRAEYDESRRTGYLKAVGPYYRLLHKVADGGFGTTYKAEHVALGEFACIKHCSDISSQAEEILRQEAKAIWSLSHYGLPHMKDLLKLEDGSYALAMTWVEGLTIQQEVEQRGKLTPEEVAWRTERVLNTLSYLHHHGVLHGDIKPQNIIVQQGETHLATLVDFGLSMVKPSASSGSKGHTKLFSPPEQIAEKTLVSGSDFYSLGMTMIYGLGGIEAVKAKTVPDDVPEPMGDFIRSLIVRNVLDRPKHADELFESFKEVRKRSFGREHSSGR